MQAFHHVRYSKTSEWSTTAYFHTQITRIGIGGGGGVLEIIIHLLSDFLRIIGPTYPGHCMCVWGGIFFNLVNKIRHTQMWKINISVLRVLYLYKSVQLFRYIFSINFFFQSHNYYQDAYGTYQIGNGSRASSHLSIWVRPNAVLEFRVRFSGLMLWLNWSWYDSGFLEFIFSKIKHRFFCHVLYGYYFWLDFELFIQNALFVCNIFGNYLYFWFCWKKKTLLIADTVTI